MARRIIAAIVTARTPGVVVARAAGMSVAHEGKHDTETLVLVNDYYTILHVNHGTWRRCCCNLRVAPLAALASE